MKHIEVEGGELALKNSFGDMVIIPKKNKKEVEKMIDTKCWECVDSFVDTLPINEDYAEDGSLYSELLTNDKSQDDFVYDAGTLNEVTITEEAPQWLKYRREYVKNNPFNIDEYVENRVNNPVGREKIKIIDTEKWKKELRQEGLETRYNSAMDYVAGELIRNKPQGNLSRAEWLDGMTAKEEEIIKRNPEYTSSLWQDTKRGLISATEITSAQTFGNILNSPDYTTREKQQMIEEYKDHPIMSKLGDAAKILSPLTVPSKMVQSAYKDGYSFTDALKGKKNDAGIVEDIFTDPLNLVGVGLMGKLSKADKVIDGTKVGSKVLGKTDDIVKPIASSADDVGKSLTQAPKPTWQMEELPGLHLNSTLPDNPKGIHSNIRKSDGTIDTRTVLDQMKKVEGDAKYAEWEKGFKDIYGEGLENLPKRMDYNDFIKTGQKNLIELEHSLHPNLNKTFMANRKKGASYVDNDLLDEQVVILSNKNKFGIGSDVHGNPKETLGHLQVVVTKENPNVLTTLGIQSDAFQGTHRIMPNKKGTTPEIDKWKKILTPESRKEAIEMGGVETADMLEADALKFLSQAENKAREALGPNPIQKQLLDKNHQERYLQELVDYAGKRGDVNKVRVPTSETAAKVQGYN
jgi:hypothetical protein